MRFTFLPKSTIGKWALGLSIFFIILICLKMQNSISLPLPTFAIAGIGLAGFTVAIIAIFRNKDKAILNFLPILVGLIIILWIAAELLFPH